jgi:hypothetical protein
MGVLESKNLCYDKIGVSSTVLYMMYSNLVSSNFHLFHKFTGLKSSLFQNHQFEIQDFWGHCWKEMPNFNALDFRGDSQFTNV